MVTLDKMIKNVAAYKSLSQHQEYEQAKQGKKLIEIEMNKLESALAAWTGFDEFNLPIESVITEVGKGAVTFIVSSYTGIKKPSYKTAVEGLENHLKGYQFMLNNSRTITGIAKEHGVAVIDVERLLEESEVIVGGILQPGVTHRIKYETATEIPIPEAMYLKGRKGSALSENNLIEYVQMDKLHASLDTFVKAYEKNLRKGGSGVKPVSSKKGYATEKSEAEGTDWAYVVKTLIQVRDNEEQGELNILADQGISLAEKKRQLPSFDLMYRIVYNERKLYVSLPSVFDRIQQLKGEETITAKRVRITPIDIV